MKLRYILFSLASLTVAQASSAANRPLDATRAKSHTDKASSLRSQLGANHELRADSSIEDDLGMTHGRFQQFYKGVRVFGGEINTHADKSGTFRQSDENVFRHINLDVTPRLRESDVLSIIDRARPLKAAFKAPPKAELVVYPVTTQVKIGAGGDATSYEYQVSKYHLAYVVTTKVETTTQIDHRGYVIDANSGEILKQWNDLHTAAATGTGNSQYSSTVTLNTNSVSGGYELRDTTRGFSGTFGNGNVVRNMNHSTSGTGTIYTDTDNAWGNGLNYNSGNGSTSANGQTAAVDVAFGIQATWDMYKYVLDRNGVSGTGLAIYAGVHYGSGVENAIWDPDCFCAVFGDGGSSFQVLTSLDVVAHELTHGLTQTNGRGGLYYLNGESGGLNESTSDIMGTMTEFYVRGGGAAAQSTTIPATGGNWTIAEQLKSTPLRYLYRPSLDGYSLDAWTPTLYTQDPHFSSGPGNRQFYFLSQGASNTSGNNYYSSYLPQGMTGIGNDKALKILFRALTTYYFSSTTYSQARMAQVNAATDLYGVSSVEVQAVKDSFAAINVGGILPLGTNLFGAGYPEVWSRGSDGNLWRVVWSGSSWTKQNIGVPASGVGIAMGLGTDTGSGGNYPEVWVKGTDGNLWRITWNGSSWSKENHGIPASGVGIAKAIGSNVVSGGYPQVFFIGTDGNVWRHVWNGGSWVNENLGTPAPGVGNATAVGTDVFNGGYPEVWVKGTDGNLWRTVWTAGGWVKENHGTPASGVSIATPIGSNVVSGGYPEVFVIGSDGNLWRHSWSGYSWLNENLGTPAGGVGNALPLGIDVVSGSYPEVWMKGTDQNIWRTVWNGSGWTKENHGKPSGLEIAMPVGSMDINGYPSVFVITAEGVLRRRSWTPSSTWVNEYISTPAN